ncbi:MAG: Asp-tRNA(Asn)/Glu-tRNA(Gln) amidotransferase subunit GatB [Patescibacteria group bacterium]
MEYQPTIGFEIHAELKTRTKMFCDSPNDPLENHPNINVCPVCMGHPGTLPVINKEAVKKVLLTGLALGGKVSQYSRFERKNYFYPDLPKGYQISQYQHPLVLGGEMTLPSSGKKIRITRIHLEEDTGRLVHDAGGFDARSERVSLVDFNRAGVPLMELVTQPDISSAEEAGDFAEEFRLVLRYLNVSEADMEKGQLRLEANVSLNMGTKVELKNINSFSALRRAIEYEIKRQEKLLKAGKIVCHETRGWDDNGQRTVLQRSKEESHDYRYFPEPDLPPVKPYEDEELNPEKLKSELPELPWQKRLRFIKEYNLRPEESAMLISDKNLSDFFEKTISELLEWVSSKNKARAVGTALNYLTSDLQGLVKEKELNWDELLVNPENFAELVKMINENSVSSRAAKDILRIMVEEGGDPSEIAQSRGLKQIGDESQLENSVKKVLEENPKAVADFKKGKLQSLQFLIGQIMRETKGAANPEVIRSLLTKIIERV